MQLAYFRLIAASLVTIAVAFTAAAQCESVAAQDNRLIVRRGEEAKVLLEDPAGVNQPRWSPNGKRIAYSRSASTDRSLSVVVVSADGLHFRTLPITDDLGVNAVMEIGWLDDGRLWFEGHVNPSVARYYVWDVDQGRIVGEMFGTVFTPSPDGKRVAYLEHLPHGAPFVPKVFVDQTLMYPLKGEAGRISNLTWSADGQRLTVLETTPSGRHWIDVDVGSREVLRSAAAEGNESTIGQARADRDTDHDTRCVPKADEGR